MTSCLSARRQILRLSLQLRLQGFIAAATPAGRLRPSTPDNRQSCGRSPRSFLIRCGVITWVAARHHPDLGPVDHQQLRAEPRLLSAELHEGTEFHNRFRVVLAEVRNRLEQRCQALEQPPGLNVASRLRLRPATRPYPVQVPKNIQFQEVRPARRAPSHILRDSLGKSRLL